MNVICFEGFPAAAVLNPDKRGVEHVTVVTKVTFEITTNGQVRPAAEQVPLVFSDEHYGAPGTSSVRYESDFAPFKASCDIILNGTAYAPHGQAVRELDVSLRLGSLRKSARIFGDRVWIPPLFGSPSVSRPIPFQQMPLVWEKAFGGTDSRAPDPKDHLFDLRNPIGVGLYARLEREAELAHRLPNIENPASLIRSRNDRPAPHGFGFIGRSWQQRLRFAGTYDEKWQQERFPFLPDDFDECYFQGAPAGQLCPYPKGSELVELVNLSPEGVLRFHLPQVSLPTIIPFRGQEVSLQSQLDTIILEPDAHRLLMVWRARTRCLGKPTDIGLIRVGTPTRAWLRAQSSGKAYVDWRRFRPPPHR
jgi:hypothetical protein